MTGLNRWMAMAIAALFVAGGTALSSFGEAKPPANNSGDTGAHDLPYVVKYELGATSFLDGDDITITEVRGTADTVALGNIYCVKGTYKLASREKASLTANVTVHKAADDGGPSLQVQNVNVNKGEGTFTLYLPIYVDGCPHVSFYSETQSTGGVYFGTGNTLYQDRKVKESKTDTAESLRAELKRLELRLNQLERHTR
jgi:hypothetical protein